VDYLVVPRILAGFIALPLLTAESISIGIAAGYVVGVKLLDIDPTYSWAHLLKYTGDTDVVIGLIKAFIFGGILTLVGCYKGMTCGLGAQGVGRATTEAVVYSSIAILISNFFLTMLLERVLNAL
jgi:phospholipid/cholesterol/gamma-HCH transport system permease protein